MNLNSNGLYHGQNRDTFCLVFDKKFSFQFMFQEKYGKIRFNLSRARNTDIAGN